MICLQETWLSENDDLSPFQIEGYNCVSKGKSCSNKGGLLRAVAYGPVGPAMAGPIIEPVIKKN